MVAGARCEHAGARRGVIAGDLWGTRHSADVHCEWPQGPSGSLAELKKDQAAAGGMGSTLWSAADMGTFPRRMRIKRFGPDHNTTDTLLLGITLRGTGKN